MSIYNPPPTTTTLVYTETPAGAINGINLTYTTLHTINAVFTFNINGQYLNPTVDYTFSGTTITMTSALPAALTGLPFVVVYQ